MKTNTVTFILLTTLLLSCGTQHLYSQTFEEFVRQRQAGFDQFQKEYNQFVGQMESRYDDFVKQRDKEFVEFLSKRWEEFQIFAGKEQTVRPKPEEAPVFMPMLEPPTPRPIPVVAPPQPITPHPRPAPMLPTMRRTEPDRFPMKSTEFVFYNNKVTLNYDPTLILSITANINNSTFSSFWRDASKANYNHLIHQLNSYRAEMNLNDWGYYLLVKNTAQSLFPHSENGAVLMTWFLMNRSGFKARAAYYNNQAMLLLASAHNIYEVSFQEFNGIRYYLVKGTADKLYTYDKDFPDAVRTINMNIYSPINLGQTTGTRQISFTFGGQTHEFNFEYSKNLIDFYNDYPLTDISVYFNSAVSPIAKESLAHQLLPVIGSKSEWDAVSFLLNLVQTEFAYKVDQEQFGGEKFFFAEEVLHYPYSDCEDRSVLFAFLVRELLEMKVIGLEYHDHIATAVKLSKETGGDFFMHRGERFIMADPTFINAPLGLTMPQYATVAARIVEIENIQYAGSISERIWETIFAAGGRRAAIRQDLAFDAKGNAFVAGYFEGNMKLGHYNLNTAKDNNGAFLAKFSNNGELVWAKQPQQQHNAIAYHVALDQEQNVFVSGTFNGEITFGTQTLYSTNNSDVFLAKYDPNGNFKWAGRAAVDTVNPELNFMFVAKFDRNGQHFGTQLFKEDENYTGFGINFDAAGNPILAGASFANTGMNVKSITYEQASAFNAVLSLKSETDILLAQDVDPGIAGLFAAINLIRLNNIMIPGSAAQEALDKYNPQFKNNAPNVYSAIGRISFMKNDQGVVYITTDNKRPITIDHLRINDNSTIKISEFKSGNAQIDILSGITVGKAVVWFDLNFVRLFRESGNMLFDFSRDNTQKTFNIRRDILY